MYGPTGIGVLYGKKKQLASLQPTQFGGDMIQEVSYDNATYAQAPAKFEAGTPPIAEAIGLGAALSWLNEYDRDGLYSAERGLTVELIEMLDDLPEVTVLKSALQVGVVSFVVQDAHPHDVAELLNSRHVAIRAGHHCAMPLMGYLGLSATLRASIGIYTKKEDIEKFITALRGVIDVLTN